MSDLHLSNRTNWNMQMSSEKFSDVMRSHPRMRMITRIYLDAFNCARDLITWHTLSALNKAASKSIQFSILLTIHSFILITLRWLNNPEIRWLNNPELIRKVMLKCDSNSEVLAWLKCNRIERSKLEKSVFAHLILLILVATRFLTKLWISICFIHHLFRVH